MLRRMSPSTPTERIVPSRERWLYGGSALVAIIYGLFCRYFFGLGRADGSQARVENVFAVMSVAFIFLVPFAIGFLATYLARERSLVRALFFPNAPALMALFFALMLAWEGFICIFLWLPLFMVMSSLGGFVGYLVVRFWKDKSSRAVAGIVVLLPFGASFPESRFEAPKQIRNVETTIAIAAPPEAVWREIVSVPTIGESEHAFAWSHLIGFPRPIAAESSGTGVGSVREASFERGVVFHEKVTEFVPNERLSFTIHADKNQIPAKALDEHVTVGGPFFDVLSGTYEVQRDGEGVLLHLSSEHRLSTRFNFYASSWTDFIMRDTQAYILHIVKERAEAKQPRNQD